MVGMILDLVGEVGDQLRSLRQVGPPRGMAVESCWYAGQPRKRTSVDRRQLWEAPVEDGGHVACGFEVATGGRCLQVAERVFTGLRRQVEEVGSQGRPGGFRGESGDVLIGLVELCEGLRSDKLLGCDVEAVGVALDRLEEPAAGSLSPRSTVLAETGVSSRPRICSSVSLGVRGEMVSGRMRVWGSLSPTPWR